MSTTRLTTEDIYAVDQTEWMRAAVQTAITETAEVPAWVPNDWVFEVKMKKTINNFFDDKGDKSDAEVMFEHLKTLHLGSAGGSTWINRVSREHMDLKSNWLTKELRRSGVKGRDSERRIGLYEERKKLKNRKDLEILWNKCPSRCAISGQLINYGLGEMKSLIDNVCLKISGKKGISASIERINPELGYTQDNIEIISAFENIGRNLGVDHIKMREERKLLDNMKSTNPMMTLEMYEKG